jgi:hypothetical protein
MHLHPGIMIRGSALTADEEGRIRETRLYPDWTAKSTGGFGNGGEHGLDFPRAGIESNMQQNFFTPGG